VKARLPVTILLLLGSILPLAGCGDGGDEGGGSGLAGIAPPSAPVFVEATLRPRGELKADVEEVVETVAGIDDLGETIISELEDSAREEGEPFDYETEVEPWLGEKGGFFFQDFGGDEVTGGMIIQTTDPGAARAFVDRQADVEKDPVREASYEGIDYIVESGEGEALGVISDFLVLGDTEQVFKKAVNAANGDSLADESAYDDAIAAAAEGSFADVYVDVGLLIEESGETIDETALEALKSAGIDPRDATAVASVIPGPDRVEVELSGDLGGQEPPEGDPSKLLGSLPADSFAAFAVTGFGEQLREAIDNLDREGIPGTIPPGQLKSGLQQVGINLESLIGSLEDASVFAQGDSERSLGGALVLTTDNANEATNTVSTVSMLLRRARTQGVTTVNADGASGFSVRSEALGRKPLVVVAKDERIAVGYGVAPALEAVASSADATLASTPAFEDGVAALGGTPISLFVDGPAALRLADSLIPPSEAEFEEAKPYLQKISSIALGAGSDGDRATAKVVIALEK
jgi:Protein of unknown function (DUF3352)